jgi:hypothetical protein
LSEQFDDFAAAAAAAILFSAAAANFLIQRHVLLPLLLQSFFPAAAANFLIQRHVLPQRFLPGAYVICKERGEGVGCLPSSCMIMDFEAFRLDTWTTYK